ncbi:MAG: efflux RND transporter permease subunit, partial [Gammaproteobacteria bacterium]|nr:efflux RND transporter permease subunit [Gammaproteobacteria bacterium]
LIHQQPEVVHTVRRTGRPDKGEHTQEVNVSEIDVSLNMGERSKEALLMALREDLGGIPGVNIVIGQPISHRIDHMLSGTRANIAVKLFGEEMGRLRALAARVQGVMSGVEGVVDLAVEPQVDIPYLSIRYDRAAMARHGIDVEAMSQTVETAFYGHEVGQVWQGQRAFDMVMRYSPERVADFEAVLETPVINADGAQIPLRALAEIRRDFGPNSIKRENAQRRLVVMANVAGRDVVSVVDEIRARVADEVDLPQGYHVEYGGQFESASSATQRLLWLGLAVIVLIFLLLFQALHSGRDALLVMLNLPMALIGGVAGVFITGGIVSVAEIIGFISLFGIATRNGVLLVAHTRHLVREEGVTSLREAVHRGATERLIPILMTALSAGLALVPLALGMGEPGSEIQAPMAWVILTGLLSSTVLNMLLLPALYYRFGSMHEHTT